MIIAHPALHSTRETRALELYRTRRHDIERIAPEVYLVPSCTGEGAYRVHYGEHESCTCPDHQYRGVACVHLLMVGISVAKRRGATLRCLDALEERLRHELLDDEER
jgi:hypothetical protein